MKVTLLRVFTKRMVEKVGLPRNDCPVNLNFGEQDDTTTIIKGKKGIRGCW